MSGGPNASAAPIAGDRDEGALPGEVAVLVVDDDPDIRETLAELLEDAGYSVTTAANGAEALERLRQVRPRLILLDLSMPVMNGQEFRARQLAEPALATIPTVVMSAADRLGEKTAAMRLDEHLAKPVGMRRLLEAVARHCARDP